MSDERAEKLARVYLTLADSELAGYCPIYETLAREMAADGDMLERFVGARDRVALVPILLFAAVHDLVLDPNARTGTTDPLDELATVYASGDGDPWPPFRRVLTEHASEIERLLQNRSVQTNEVGRTACVYPALSVVQQHYDQPLALVELGPSAGLNLLLDRYAYDYGDGRVAGDEASSVRLTCECRGTLEPPLAPSLSIASRQGIDLNPLDVNDDDDRRWLDACLWPGLDYRRQRLQAAIELARTETPTLHQGSATALLPRVLDSIDDGAVPVVVATWVLGYFSAEERTKLKAVLDAAGAHRSLAFISGEYPHVVGWLPEPATPATTDDPRGASLLGVSTWDSGPCDARSIAWMQAHGLWLDWLDQASAA